MSVMGYYSFKLEASKLRKDIEESLALFGGNFRARQALYQTGLELSIQQPNKEDITYPSENPHYQSLFDSDLWLAEMSGYSIFDPGDCGIMWAEEYDDDGVPTIPKEYEETDSFEPGIRTELMSVFAPEFGPYNLRVDIDIRVASELLDCGTDIIDACRWAQDAQAYSRLTGMDTTTTDLGYSEVIEDTSAIVDSTLSRGLADFLDSWDGETAYRAELDREGPTGLCPDRARFMRIAARERNERFLNEIRLIAGSNVNDLKKRYYWHKSPKKRGEFWSCIYFKHLNNPEPGLMWLTHSHTVLVNWAYRRKLGIPISSGLQLAASRAIENVREPIKKHLGCEKFDLSHIEWKVNGKTPYYWELHKYYNP